MRDATGTGRSCVGASGGSGRTPGLWGRIFQGPTCQMDSLTRPAPRFVGDGRKEQPAQGISYPRVYPVRAPRTPMTWRRTPVGTWRVEGSSW